MLGSHALGALSGSLAEYTRTGSFPPDPEARHLASFLLLHRVPSPLRLTRACKDLADMSSAISGGSAGLPANAAPLVGMVMRDVSPSTAVLMSSHIAGAAVGM